jgi:nucleoside-diphosphate-sugar epimerase
MEENAMAKSLLILGSAGFIGTAIRRAAAADYELLSVDLVATPAAAGLTGVARVVGEERYAVDLGSPEEIDGLWTDAHLDARDIAAVIHLAAYYDFRNRPDPRYDRLVQGLAHLLKRLGDALDPDIPFLYASSMAAMAPTDPGQKQVADSPRAGLWEYPRHKREAEATIEAAAIPQPRVELVLAAVYSKWCELVPLYQHIEQVARRSPLSSLYPGSVDRGLTYVHLSSVAEAFLRSIDAFRGRSGVHRLLIGEDRPVTYFQIHRAAQRAFGRRQGRIRRIPKWLARVGAQILVWMGQLFGKSSFIHPWMIDFAGEHFEFDLRPTRQLLEWQPDGYLGDRLVGICERAAIHREIWLAKNEARQR